MLFERGYSSPFMATNQERMEAVLSNPYILITDKKITSTVDLLPLLERLMAAGRKELMRYRRGYRGGSTDHAGGKQDARCLQCSGSEGTELWRPS